MNASEAVAEILERSGATKSSLSAKSGVSRALIDDYLKGRRQPSVAQLERLGESVGLRLDLAWRDVETGVVEPVRGSDPSWLISDNAEMADPPTSRAERAVLLARVIPLGRELQRRPRPSDMEFPPFRTLVRR